LDASTSDPAVFIPDSTFNRHVQPSTARNIVDLASSAAAAQERYDGPTNLRHDGTALDIQDNETLLVRYQRLMAPYIPFVVIPIGVTAQDLAKTRPFLLQAIITVASFHNTTIQQMMAKDLMCKISERLLIYGEKSMDLLQGKS
jgi:hypothetical protein